VLSNFILEYIALVKCMHAFVKWQAGTIGLHCTLLLRTQTVRELVGLYRCCEVQLCS